MAARKKTTVTKRTTKAKAVAKPAPKKAPARKLEAKPAAAPKKRGPSPAELLAKKIVEATISNFDGHDLLELYSPDCVSYEPRGEPATGYEGLQKKGEMWRSIQKRSIWKPRNVMVQGDTICIEWDAEVELRDGRLIQMHEVAIHETQAGKIVSERYYYDMSILFEPPPSADAPVAPPRARPAPPSPATAAGQPPLDPSDL